MPAVEKTSLEDIVAAGRALLDAGGRDAVTMNAVAAAVGVRAPSLYKRIDDRSHLIRLLAEGVVAELGERLDAAAARASAPADALRAMGIAFRAYAHEAPRALPLIFGPAPDAERAGGDIGARTIRPVLDTTAALVGEADALNAARTLTAWLNGFVLMELAGDFRSGGSIDEAFAWGLDRVVAALAGPRAG